MKTCMIVVDAKETNFKKTKIAKTQANLTKL